MKSILLYIFAWYEFKMILYLVISVDGLESCAPIVSVFNGLTYIEYQNVSNIQNFDATIEQKRLW